MNAREIMLDKIRAAIADVPQSELAAWPPERSGDSPGSRSREATAELFVARLADYGVAVREVTAPTAVPAALDAECAARGITRVVCPKDLPAHVRPTSVECLIDEPPLPVGELDRIGCVVTTSALAIAETGTVVLDGGSGQGRRALSLVPDIHFCVLGERDIRRGVQEAFAELAVTGRAHAPLTFISGPSATFDIGFERVSGVHGPRALIVVLVRDQPGQASTTGGLLPR